MDFSNNNLKRNIIIIAFVLLVVIFIFGITISIVSSKKNIENSGNNQIESSSNNEILDGDLKELAEMAYINTSNEEVNSIYNKMIDNVVKQHTIKFSIENDEGFKEEIALDIPNKIIKITGETEDEVDEQYNIFSDLESITYESSWNEYMLFKNTEKIEKNSMLKILFDYFLDNIDLEDCKVKLKENDDTYVIELKDEYNSLKYTVDKEDFLLSDIKMKYYDDHEIKVSYDKENIELPEKYLNLDKEYVTANDEEDSYITYYIYMNDENANLDNISFDVPNNFELITDDPYEKEYEYHDTDKDAYIMFSISAIKTKSIENLKKYLEKEIDDVISSEVYSEKINGINWDFISVSNSWRQLDYGIFEYDDKIYLVTYSMDYELEDKDCFADIIWSIKQKDDQKISR